MSKLKLSVATIADLDKVYSAFASRKDLFPHIRKDYVERQIKKGVVVFHKSVFIIFDEYKRRQKLGTTYAERGDIILHQIVNTEQGNGLASKVWDAWVKQFVAQTNLVLTVRASNDTARKFYERKGMKVAGDIAWSGGELPGTVYYMENVAKTPAVKSSVPKSESKTKEKSATTKVVDEHKDWQKGISLERILTVHELYEKYNGYSFSRFASMGKDSIANCMSNNSLRIVLKDSEKIGAFTVRVQKVRSVVNMTKHAIIGVRLKDDVVIEAVTLLSAKNRKLFVTELKQYIGETRCWLHCWAEDKVTVAAVESAGFIKVGIKPKSTGELEAIYFKRVDKRLEEVLPLTVTAFSETITYSKPLLGKFKKAATAMAKRLAQMGLDFSMHPSGSNKDGTWSAVSVRGYSKNILNIHDPDSAPAAWVNDKMLGKVVDTKLMAKFPEVLAILKTLGISSTERIRFMRLTPGGGELTRHTDLISDKFGTHDQGIVRLHVPLITNPDVKFTMWDYNGDQAVFSMGVGDLCYLDARKPHSAINGGKTDRVHLVIDAYCNDKLRKLLSNNAG
jgi:hypothetical protein